MSNPAAAVTFPRHMVLGDVIPGARTRDVALVIGGAILTALLAQVAIDVPPSPVPITGQTLAVGLVGATLGMRRGSASLALYALLGLFLPFYSEGASGWDVVYGASGGYIIGFIFAAGLVGYLAERGADRKVLAAFGAFVAGQLVIFAFGLTGLKLATDMDWGWVVHNGFSIFIIGGLIKAAVGAAVLPAAWAGVRHVERTDDDKE